MNNEQLDKKISYLSTKQFRIGEELDVLRKLQAERLLSDEQMAIYNHPEVYRENYSGAMLYDPKTEVIQRIRIQSDSWLEICGMDKTEKIKYDEVSACMFPCNAGLHAHIKVINERYKKPSE